MPILSREVGQRGTSTRDVAQIISISGHLDVPMLIFSREGGQMGSTFEAAQIFPISEYLKEPLLTFRREVGLVLHLSRPSRGRASGRGAGSGSCAIHAVVAALEAARQAAWQLPPQCRFGMRGSRFR